MIVRRSEERLKKMTTMPSARCAMWIMSLPRSNHGSSATDASIGFTFACVGLEVEPKESKWYCDPCGKARRMPSN